MALHEIMYFWVTFLNYCLYIDTDVDIYVSSHNVHEVGMIEAHTTKSSLAMAGKKGKR